MKLILPGRIVDAPPLEEGLSAYVNTRVIRAQDVEAGTRAAGVEEHVLEDADPDDILEFEYKNGVKQWISVAQLQEDLRQTPGQRAASVSSEGLRVPVTPFFAQRSRGLFDWVLKGLKVLKVDPVEGLASAAVQTVLERFESKLNPHPGLYRLSEPGKTTEQVTSEGVVDVSRPALVFIHGTASSLAAGFGGLSGSSEWQAIVANYGDQVYGFQHPTLSLNPVENAIELAKLLPARARLHFVTHSRGGLVGELLCLDPLTKKDLDVFRAAGREAEAEQLERLSDLLVQKSFQVERFVRVACPARGTLLASRRLDRYLSLILNVLGLIPGLQVSPVYDFVKATLLELAKRRTDPKEVPGLEAQMPESPLIHLLNRPNGSSQADLAVIAGDIQGRGIWQHLKVFATDLFYLEDHDLIVNTRSMYGGLRRERGVFYFFDSGPEVNHFSYFRNPSTRGRILGWLTGAPGAAQDPNFMKLSRAAVTPLVIPRKRDVAAAANLPVLFLLPGIMGSHLAHGKDRIWLDFSSLMFGGMRRLHIDRTGIRAEALVAMAYERLTAFLQASYDVLPFPYDWRLSIADEAARLRREVRSEMAKHDRPIRFLAHSMGGLVVRAMIAQDLDLWEELVQERGCRLVMLGTPNRGSYVIPRLLFRVHPTFRKLALLDILSSPAELAAIVARYPGVLEMLPEGGEPDFFAHSWWRDQREATLPIAADLVRAKRFRERLKSALDPSSMIYVAGSARSTPSGLIRENGRVEWISTPSGDGTVPYDLGLLPRVPSYYMTAEHGSLANHPPAFGPILELLERGDTTKLSRQAPAIVRDIREGEIIRDDAPLLFPTEEDLVASALGAEMLDRRTEISAPLQLIISHGHLRQAAYPLAIGHYAQDTIVSAEQKLDQQLGGRLSRRFQMDLYPGPAGTCEVVLAPECSPPGALVVGLGNVGELTPERVRTGVREVALKYALALAEEPRDPAPETRRSVGISSVLIGSTGGNALSVADSLTAIVQGVLEANRLLREKKLGDRVQIDALEIIELYENVAAEAMRAAQSLPDLLPHELAREQGVVVADSIRVLEGGQQQPPVNQYHTGWWRRVQITGDETRGKQKGTLRFVLLTDRARAEETWAVTQPELIERLTAATTTTGYDEAAAATLFHLLVPLGLRERTEQGAHNLVLVLDEESAQYPWELLSRRTASGIRAMAIDAGLIRQFSTRDFRPNPRQPRGNTALVIGDTESGYSDLPGAREEAKTVSSVLVQKGWVVRKHLKPDAVTVMTELFAADYKIVHLAAHGIYNPDEPAKSGMVLGDGIFLLASEVRKLPVVPELVFVNCCHLGRIDQRADTKLTVRSPHKLAASVSRELIEMGVKAVVAAGWAVDDLAASTFAAEFYARMLAGESFGTAVHRARVKTYEQHANTNTWGAYQAYGNPDFKLSFTGTDGSVAAPPGRYFSRGEYLARLRGIRADAKDLGAGGKALADRRKEVEEISRSIPVQWKDGEILSAIGDAWAELNDFGKAIEAYRSAAMRDDALAPVRTLEQLANLSVRHAAAMREKAAGAKRGAVAANRAADALNKEAIQWLEMILRIRETSERLALLGSAYKRLALAASGTKRRQMLLRAEDTYRRAHQRALDETGVIDPYPALNWIACRFLLNRGKKEELSELTNQIRAEAARRAKADPSFWKRVTEAEATLLGHLAAGDLAKHGKSVLSLYRQAISGGATPREVASVTDQLAFYAESLPSQLKGKARSDAVQALQWIREEIKKNEGS